jgi:hypothetical protein
MVTSVLILGLIHVSAHAQSVTGRLYVVKGRAHVVGASDQDAQLVQVCRANDKIEVGNRSVAIVWMLDSGSRYQLASPSIVKIVNGVPVALKGAGPKPLSKLGSRVTAVFQNAGSQAAVQVRNEENVRITPSGGLLKAPDTISWNRLSEAKSYDVSVTAESATAPAFHAEGLDANSVAIPIGVFLPGKVYRLTLASNTSNGGCVLSFRTLRWISPSQLAALKEAEKELDSGTSPSPEVQLAKADLFEQYDLYRESLGCLAKLKQPTNAQAQEIAKLESLAEGRS